MKAKIGYPTLAEDLAVIRAMRSAVGPGVAVMVDYNQSAQPRPRRRRRLQALDGEGLDWIEEPVLAHDYAALQRAGRASRARRCRPARTGGDRWTSAMPSTPACAGLAMPDAMKCGGVTGWQRIAALAQLHGVALSSHLWPELSAQLLCATPTARWLEHVEWWNPDPAGTRWRSRDGMAHASERVGSAG